MHKGITILILLVVLAAMGLVMYSHTGADKEVPAAERGDQTPQASGQSLADSRNASSPSQPYRGAGLSQIEPPLSAAQNAIPPSGRQANGAPVPLTLTPGADGRGESPATRIPPSSTPPPAPVVPPTAANATQSGAQTPAITPPAAPGGTNTEPETRQDVPAQRPSSGSPELTPWEKPIREEQGKKPDAGANATAPPPKEQPAKEQPLSLTGKHALSAISLGFADQGMRLRIEAGDAFPCKTFILTGPDRLVIDLPGTWSGMKAPSVPKNNLVQNVRLGQQPSGPRLVLDLHGRLKDHAVERSGNTVEVRLR